MNTKYENSLFYQINSSAKYFQKIFDQLFKELDLGICATEHLALCVIIDTKECCQRDLAKIILKDRAGTGKLAQLLEEKGLINIELKIKNNRPVKILSATERGKVIAHRALEIIKPLTCKIEDEISTEIIEKTIKTLKDFKKIVRNIIKPNI